MAFAAPIVPILSSIGSGLTAVATPLAAIGTAAVTAQSLFSGSPEAPEPAALPELPPPTTTPEAVTREEVPEPAITPEIAVEQEQERQRTLRRRRKARVRGGLLTLETPTGVTERRTLLGE